MATDNTELLLEALNLQDTDTFKINVMEALAALLLMNHWMRGMFTWLHHVKVVEYKSENHRQNYLRLNKNIELYEEMLWEIVPPRAMLQQLRLLRTRGYLDEDFAKLLEADVMGRYDLKDKEVKEVIDRGNEVDGRAEVPLR